MLRSGVVGDRDAGKDSCNALITVGFSCPGTEDTADTGVGRDPAGDKSIASGSHATPRTPATHSVAGFGH